MGLFSSKKETYVSSVVYNMAGPIEDRPIYLHTVMFNRVLYSSNASVADVLAAGYRGGPGMKLRQFFNWSKYHYSMIGIPTSTKLSSNIMSNALMSANIPATSGWAVAVQRSQVIEADYTFWVEKYFLENALDKVNLAWNATINESTGVITITIPGHPTVNFTPANFVKGAVYVASHYNEYRIAGGSSTNTGSATNIGLGSFPATNPPWVLYDTVNQTRYRLLNKTTDVVSTFSDGRPNETSTNSVDTNTSYTYTDQIYRRLASQTIVDLNIIVTFDYRHNMTDYVINPVPVVTTDTVVTEISPGVTKTTTTTITEQVLLMNRSYRTDQTEDADKEWTQLKLDIYRVGTGRTDVDNAVSSISGSGEYYPVIPVRLNNQFVSPSHNLALYEEVKKAYKRATAGGKFDDMIAQLEDNEDLGDIDYAYIMFGVSLNTVERSAKKYAYHFLRNMMLAQVGGPTIYETWKSMEAAYQAYHAQWSTWYNGGGNVGGAPTAEPTRPARINYPANEIHISQSGFGVNFQYRLKWTFINEVFGTGQGKVGAKKGDLWFQKMGTDTVAASLLAFDQVGGTYTSIFNGFGNVQNETQKVRLYWQYEDNAYKYLDIVGLYSTNYVYNKKSVLINATQALDDSDESGLILPMHHETTKQMSLVEFTQMTTASVYMVFNCYQVVKRKWYQRGIFKILLVVVIAVASVVFPGLGIAMPSILGTNIAIGTALGLSGMAAAIAGAVANAIAAMVLTSIITKGAVALLGEEIGFLIGAIVSTIAIGSLNSWHNGISGVTLWGQLTKIDNLMKFTEALGQGYVAKIQREIDDLNGNLDDYLKGVEGQIADINQKYYDEFGGSGGIIPGMALSNPVNFYNESSDTFLTRTLMTGHDLADLGHRMINEFASLNLKLDGPFK